MKKKRSVERDYKYFDPPKTIWQKIHANQWLYKTNQEHYYKRDLCLMAILYLSACRIAEITKGKTRVGILEGVKKNQFVARNSFLYLANLPIIKQAYNRERKRHIERIDDFPRRTSIDFPLKGGLAAFTNLVTDYLDDLEEDETLFSFGRVRGYQIVYACSGEFPHYFRAMGLKMRIRLLEGQASARLIQLQKFSGHSRIENLLKYLDELDLEKAREKMLKVKPFL